MYGNSGHGLTSALNLTSILSMGLPTTLPVLATQQNTPLTAAALNSQGSVLYVLAVVTSGEAGVAPSPHQ